LKNAGDDADLAARVTAVEQINVKKRQPHGQGQIIQKIDSGD